MIREKDDVCERLKREAETKWYKSPVSAKSWPEEWRVLEHPEIAQSRTSSMGLKARCELTLETSPSSRVNETRVNGRRCEVTADTSASTGGKETRQETRYAQRKQAPDRSQPGPVTFS